MDWTQIYHTATNYFQAASPYIILILGYALKKSEQWACDPTVKQNGWKHGYLLVKGTVSQVLTVLPPAVIKDVETKADAALPGVGQLIEELTKPATEPEIPKEETTP